MKVNKNAGLLGGGALKDVRSMREDGVGRRRHNAAEAGRDEAQQLEHPLQQRLWNVLLRADY